MGVIRFIAKVIKKLLLIDYIRVFIANRALLNILVNMSGTDLDNKALKYISGLVDTNTAKLPNVLKEVIAKKLSADKRFIPELEFEWDEKKGFRTSVNMTL